MQVLALCRDAGIAKLGHVALDGTKVPANASKHKAMSLNNVQNDVDELLPLVDQIEELHNLLKLATARS